MPDDARIGQGAPLLRTITAAYPSPTQPRRGQFIAKLHADLAPEFATEVLAPHVFARDPAVECRDGISVTRFRYASGDRPPKAASDGHGGPGPWLAISYLRSVSRAARKLWPAPDARPSIVLAHWAVPSGWAGRQVARRLGLPLVLYGHGTDIHRYGRLWWSRRWLGALIRDARRTIVVSEALADIAAAVSGRKADSFPVIPIGIDPMFVAPTEDSEHERRGNGLRLLYVGDWIATKGVDVLARAVDELGRRGVGVALTAIGSGPLEPALRAAGAECIVDGDSRAVRDAMAAADLLVLPSHAEGTPLVVQEALAMALPVLATPVGGIPRLFGDRVGWIPLSAAPTAQELSDAVASLAADSQSLVRTKAAMRGNATADLYRARTVEKLKEVLCPIIA